MTLDGEFWNSDWDYDDPPTCAVCGEQLDARFVYDLCDVCAHEAQEQALRELDD